MKEELVSYKTVKLAQKKGIDFRSKEFSSASSKANKAGTYHSYVTQALLQKYLREIHNIQIDIRPNDTDYDIDVWKRIKNDDSDRNYKGEFKTYEQALEEGLQEALNLI